MCRWGQVHFKSTSNSRSQGQVHFKSTSSPLQVHFKSTSNLRSQGQVHFKSTSSPLQVHFKSTSSPLQVHFKSTSNSRSQVQVELKSEFRLCNGGFSCLSMLKWRTEGSSARNQSKGRSHGAHAKQLSSSGGQCCMLR
jgi:hypothetical protein